MIWHPRPEHLPVRWIANAFPNTTAKPSNLEASRACVPDRQQGHFLFY